MFPRRRPPRSSGASSKESTPTSRSTRRSCRRRPTTSTAAIFVCGVSFPIFRLKFGAACRYYNEEVKGKPTVAMFTQIVRTLPVPVYSAASSLGVQCFDRVNLSFCVQSTLDSIIEPMQNIVSIVRNTTPASQVVLGETSSFAGEGAGKPPRLLLASGLHSSKSASNIVADRDSE